MVDRHWSLADHAVHVIGELDRMLDGIDNDHPHRYPLRRLKQIADAAAYEGLRHAAEIISAAKVLRQELDEARAEMLAEDGGNEQRSGT